MKIFNVLKRSMKIFRNKKEIDDFFQAKRDQRFFVNKRD